MKRFFVLILAIPLLSGYAHSQSPLNEHEIQVQAGLIFNPTQESFRYAGMPAGYSQANTTLIPGIGYSYHSKVWGVEASTAYRQIAFQTKYVHPTDTFIPSYPQSLRANGHFLNMQGTAFLRICQSENSDFRIGGGMGVNIRLLERFTLLREDFGLITEQSGSIFPNMITYAHLVISYRKYFLQKFFFDARGMMQFTMSGVEPNPLFISPVGSKQLSVNLGLGMKILPKTTAL